MRVRGHGVDMNQASRPEPLRVRLARSLALPCKHKHHDIPDSTEDMCQLTSFRKRSSGSEQQDTDLNHTSPCDVSTPPSSPLDSPPPAPAPAAPIPAHYISSLRASSRRGGGSGGGVSPEKERDPLARLLRFLRAFYRELAGRDPAHPPPWAPPLPPGTMCPAHFQPSLQLAPLGSGRSDSESRDAIRLDQILSTIRTSEGIVYEAPRRVVVEGAPGSGKTTLALRLLHSWATQEDWLGPSIQLALFVPLRELRGSSLAHYLSKELLPKTALGGSGQGVVPGVGGNGFAHVWKCLGLLEDRLLFVLDGYDEAVTLAGIESGKGQSGGSGTNTNAGREALGDAVELLEGRLFPDCRILVTCCSGWSSELIPLVQRRVLLHGLDWLHVERLVTAYFVSNKKPESANRFIEVVCASQQVLRPLACWPLGWLLLCVMFEEEGGNLPSDTLDVHQALFKCLIRRSLVRKGEILMSNTSSSDLPGHCKKLLAEFGKLALICIKEDRFVYTDAEIRSHCRGGGLEVTELGFLTRGLNFGRSYNLKKRADYYTPLLRTFAEFLAAYYISSVVHYANILRRELEDLPGLATAGHASSDNSTVLILRFLMGLLGRKGHLVFNQLCPLDFPTRTLFMLLQAAGPSEANVAAVCRLLGASSSSWVGLGTGGSWSGSKVPIPLVHTAPLELEGWSHVLRSDACTLEALELVFQFDKGADCEELLDNFFSALSANDSVRLVRISSLLGHEFTSSEVSRLAGYVRTTLPKSRLHTFELVITCLEDSAHDRFQSLVDALCAGLEQEASPSLSKLVLDLNLGTNQVVQLCSALENTSQVSVLHLPHLGCGREGLRAIANLIRARPLVALNLAGSWGMRREDPPSSSGVSVGSGSGSSGGVGSGVNTLQHLTKQPSLLSNVSPKTSSSSYYFSSLPRGVMGGYNSLGRPATLPRQPLQQLLLDGYSGDSKRNSDSVLFQRLFHPLPACDPTAHAGSGFHDVFEAARDPACKLRSLNVSKCLLGAEDALCLGETIRRSTSLDALRLEGGTRLGEVLPVLLGLSDNNSLQLLDLGSQRLVLEDGPTQLVCQSLAKNNSLRLLSLDGWTFRIEEEGSLAVFLGFLQNTSVRDLVLANCRLHLAIHDGRLSRLGRHDDSVAELLTSLPEFLCPAVVFLRLGGFQVTVNDRMALRGPHLLPFLRGFTHLTDLDLSLDKNNIGSANSNPLVVDDKVLITFFQTLSTSFRTLQSLKMSHWKMCLDDSERTLRAVGRALKTCSLSYLKVNGLGVTDSGHRSSLEHLFLQTVVANLSYLSWLSMVGVALTPGQATAVGKCIRDRFPGTGLELSAKDVGTEAVKALVAILEEGSKVEVMFVGGPTCNLRIQRILKNQKLKGKFRRFTSLKE
ncbi:uncharacterized protein [Anabrus simplex]|uniref:uncharacterized protein n=1 Tax=Anabrus simplex TaxID=316456 RepID=UPI0035A2E513